MTEGTSQGLFVVVAIVFFGIFVGLSYTLFGDTLKPALADLFTNATEQTTADLNKENVYPKATASEFFSYTINSDGNSYTLTKYIGTFTDVVIPKEIEGKPVTIIDANAFYSGTYEPSNPISVKLTSVIIPNTVTKIGEAAFAYNSLTSVEIPDSVTTIGSSAFRYNSLTSVIIPNSVTSIGSYAFQGNNLTSVNIPDSVTTIGTQAFMNNSLTSVEIPNSVTSIGYGAFRGNSLTSVVIPDSVTSIGQYAFYGNKLTSVEIPDSVTEIGTIAFTGNTTLKTVELPYGFEIVDGTYQTGAVITNRTE